MRHERKIWSASRRELERASFLSEPLALPGGAHATWPEIYARDPRSRRRRQPESVLDEHLWIASKLDADAITRFPRDLKKVLGLYEGRHRVHESGDGGDPFQLRCHAAMPFADAKVENAAGGEDRLRTDDMRRAFNTPFWPHVLTTTSLGQEGLDFHVWCRQLLHWDLCPSPLDLEQREGRIQRFGGLSVRAALAGLLRDQALRDADPSSSPWLALADYADRQFSDDTSGGLKPWWSCPNEKIDRIFVVMPQSRQTAKFDQLSELRWLYRLALGQPHQQDFIERIAQLKNDGRQEYVLSLSAWPHFSVAGVGTPK